MAGAYHVTVPSLRIVALVCLMRSKSLSILKNHYLVKQLANGRSFLSQSRNQLIFLNDHIQSAIVILIYCYCVFKF